jgi:hypothetical protein
MLTLLALFAALSAQPQAEMPAPHFALFHIATRTPQVEVIVTPAEAPTSLPAAIQRDGDKLHVVADGSSHLSDLVQTYAELEGIRILADLQVQGLLEGIPFMMYGAPSSLNSSELTPFVEGVLRDSDFILSANGGAHSYTIRSVTHGRSSSMNWLQVPSSEIRLMREHPALLMQTILVLENVDARQLSTNLRPVFQNPAYQSIMNMGNSNAILMRGTGLELARTVRFLSEVDAASAASAQARNQAQVQGQRGVAAAEAPVALQANVDAPHLVTRIFEIEGSLLDIANKAEGLTRGRYNTEAKGRLWQSKTGVLHSWPAPRYWTASDTNRVMVQAAESDFAAIEGDLKLAAKLHHQDT